MSNINNHGVDMNNDVLFQELSCEKAAIIQGGAAIQLFTDANFQGVFGEFNFKENVPAGFNDRISSIKVLSGKWNVWSDANQTGVALTELVPGDYPTLPADFNDVISSIEPVIQ
ncbi:beta/gamma crystallin family protein [Nostoc sp. CHAB 5824]|nr:beta/gamma crystallin family protein [Nostoc sp. CHAB 5824]